MESFLKVNEVFGRFDSSLGDAIFAWQLYFMISISTCFLMFIYGKFDRTSLFKFHWIRLLQPLSFRFLGTQFNSKSESHLPYSNFKKYSFFLSLFISGLPILLLSSLALLSLFYDVQESDFFSNYVMFDYPPRIYEDFLGYNYERINFVMAVCGLPVTMISSGFFIVFCFGGPFVLLGFLSDKYLPTGNRNLKFKDYFGKKRRKDNDTNGDEKEDFIKQQNLENLEVNHQEVVRSLRLLMSSFLCTLVLYKLNDLLIFVFVIAFIG